MLDSAVELVLPRMSEESSEEYSDENEQKTHDVVERLKVAVKFMTHTHSSSSCNQHTNI